MSSAKSSVLLAIDPGGRGTGETGVVLLEYGPSTPATLLNSWAVPDSIEGFREWHKGQGDLLSQADVVVCEQFINRNIRGADLSPLLIEGAVRLLRPDVVLQPAAGRKSAVPDTALKRLELYEVGTGDHHQDRREAARHAIWYLKKELHLPTIKKGWPPTV